MSRRIRSGGRSGFTIVEMITVLTVLVLLAAVLLPAVQSVRETSRRTECSNHLRQLALAVQHFESAHQEFPAAMHLTETYTRQRDGRTVDRSSRPFSPHVHLLPYVDQNVVHQQIDFSRGPDEYVGNPADNQEPPLNTSVSLFVCPSDGDAVGTNYRVCVGDDVSAFPQPYASHKGTGAFAGMRGRRTSEVTDGLAHTVAFSESVKSPRQEHGSFQTGDYWTSGMSVFHSFPSSEDLLRVCESAGPDPTPFYPYSGLTWAVASYAFTWYNHVLPPNSEIVNCTADGWRNWDVLREQGTLHGIYKASSRHSGGVIVAYLDGHVDFIADEIDLGVWRATASIAGEEKP